MSIAEEELHSISQIPGVGTVLDVLCQTTGLRIALIAHATEDLWTVCAVRDGTGFGLKPGDQLHLGATY